MGDNFKIMLQLPANWSCEAPGTLASDRPAPHTPPPPPKGANLIPPPPSPSVHVNARRVQRCVQGLRPVNLGTCVCRGCDLWVLELWSVVSVELDCCRLWSLLHPIAMLLRIPRILCAAPTWGWRSGLDIISYYNKKSFGQRSEGENSFPGKDNNFARWTPKGECLAHQIRRVR